MTGIEHKLGRGVSGTARGRSHAIASSIINWTNFNCNPFDCLPSSLGDESVIFFCLLSSEANVHFCNYLFVHQIEPTPFAWLPVQIFALRGQLLSQMIVFVCWLRCIRLIFIGYLCRLARSLPSSLIYLFGCNTVRLCALCSFLSIPQRLSRLAVRLFSNRQITFVIVALAGSSSRAVAIIIIVAHKSHFCSGNFSSNLFRFLDLFFTAVSAVVLFSQSNCRLLFCLVCPCVSLLPSAAVRFLSFSLI